MKSLDSIAAAPPLKMELPVRLPELLAPAGDWECARAAVENGADAIYFGLDKFNARMRAHNFCRDDLPKLMEFLHQRGVKGYVTFNTLVFENEMAEAEECLRDIIAAGVDAAIVQDVGICRLIRRLSPDFPIHVSTQMTVTSAAGVEFARELGCQLVVLARECSLKEIKKIFAASAAPMPLEVFVHGALCVAYSGQCLTSESLGGRSANRGVCAQACRLPYELVSDGQDVPLGDRKYLLSPQDLAGLPVLPDLVRSGVASLKIEGRLKSPEYVANITRVYRQALDELSAGNDVAARHYKQSDGDSPSPGGEGRGEGELKSSRGNEAQYEMEMAFSRGLYTGWFGGINNQQLVHARFGKKRGVYLGEIVAVEGRNVRLTLEGPLKPGDGVVFDAGHPEAPEEGGRVYTVERRGGDTLLGFGHGDIDLTRIHRGDKLWKTSDPELERNLRQTFAGEAPKFQRPLAMEVRGAVGKPFTLVVRDEAGHEARIESAMPLVRADKQPLTPERLRAQLGRLGGTPFTLGELKSSLEGDVLLPVSELNRLRRVVVEEMLTRRGQPRSWTLNVGVQASACIKSSSQSEASSRLIVLVRSLPQLQAAMDSGVQTVYCEFEDPKKYRDAVKLFWETSCEQPKERAIYVAPPRIFKMGEEW
ncbi:MAG TPA: U32 family peptidase, partial [Candidatus Acidoferrum sp.]|nr:U32 family peptidase [Candidatus Acidoferrum sp.]